jgi:hypothetical protein
MMEMARLMEGIIGFYIVNKLKITSNFRDDDGGLIRALISDGVTEKTVKIKQDVTKDCDMYWTIGQLSPGMARVSWSFGQIWPPAVVIFLRYVMLAFWEKYHAVGHAVECSTLHCRSVVIPSIGVDMDGRFVKGSCTPKVAPSGVPADRDSGLICLRRTAPVLPHTALTTPGDLFLPVVV